MRILGDVVTDQQRTAPITPIFVTVKEAAAILGGGTSPWTMNRLCKLGAIESKFQANRRMVSLVSLHEYAANLPESQESA